MFQISAPVAFPQSPSLADDEPTSIRIHERSGLANAYLPAADMDIQTSPQFQEDETLSSDWIKCPSFSNVYNYIGDIFYDSGLFLDALELYQDALAGREEEFDLYHPSILAILYSMGLSYFRLGDFGRARGCLLQVLEAQETLLCKGHSAIQSTVKDLGRMCYENGDYEEAQMWYERVLAGAREL